MPAKQPHADDTDVLLEFLYRLGQAYLASGEQTPRVELTLRRIATAYGMRNARVVAFPTALFITVHDGKSARVTLSEGATQLLRLDQVAAVYALGSTALANGINPEKGLVPPLVTFLPGAMLTYGMVELAYGDMVSGSSRLITGLVQLVLLAFGIAAGALLIGVGPQDLLGSVEPAVKPPWARWSAPRCTAG